MIDKKTEFNYKCVWCGHEFKQKVGTTLADVKPRQAYQSQHKNGTKKRRSVSSQVVCPNCGNFLKTWSGI